MDGRVMVSSAGEGCCGRYLGDIEGGLDLDKA